MIKAGRLLWAVLLFTTLFCQSVMAADQAVARIVLMRHAEKPEAGLGQISCKGLRRALLLPDLLINHFGQPDHLIAPNPGIYKKDHGISYAYLRPLVTLEPTAIRLGMPIATDLGFDEEKRLRERLLQYSHPPLQTWVSWEHKILVIMERKLVSDLGVTQQNIPDWDDNDFDRLDVIEVTPHEGKQTVTVTQQHEGLNNLPDTCPSMPLQ